MTGIHLRSSSMQKRSEPKVKLVGYLTEKQHISERVIDPVGGGRLSPTITAGETGIVKLDKMKDQKTRPDGKGWCWDEEQKRWFRVRKLTPRECFRLMDVKEENIDKMMATDENGKQIISNSQLYKCAGNSIVVAPMALTFLNIFAPETDKKHKTGEQLSLF